MSVHVGNLKLDLNVDETINAASRSFASVSEALLALDSISEATAKLVDPFAIAGDDCGDLIIGDPGKITAIRAGDVLRLQINPSDLYLELCAAIADERDAYSVSFCHGWPILSSVGSASPTVTELGAGGNIGPEGGAS